MTGNGAENGCSVKLGLCRSYALPGLAIFITTLVINLMGNALRDWLDPHMKE